MKRLESRGDAQPRQTHARAVSPARAHAGPLAPARADPGPLAERLLDLPVEIDGMTVRTGCVPADGYPDGPRPTGVVRLEGGGCAGLGECVAWTATDQERFAAVCRGLSLPDRGTVAAIRAIVRSATADRYERAALESAVLDLALCQAGTNPFELSDVAPRPVRFAVSLDASRDPLPVLRRLLERSPETRIKLDVDPRWPDATLADLASLAVVVLDLKLRGNLTAAERLHAALPEALIEDPRLDDSPGRRPDAAAPSVEATYARGGTPAEVVGGAIGKVSSGLRGRVTLDGPILSASDVAALPLIPAAVNVKPARMGGFVEALRAIAACRRAGIATYVGGMFEVGPGRSQVQALASLFSPDAWNDVAPIAATQAAPVRSSPLAVPENFTGLGFDNSVRF